MKRSTPKRLTAAALCFVWIVGAANDAGAQSRTGSIPAEIVRAGDCPGLVADQERYRERILAPMSAWAERMLPDPGDRPIVYPFAGADVATALALFGRSPRLIMLSRQEVSLAQLWAAPPEIESAECDTQRFFTRTGFYRTLDLDGKVDGRQAAAPRLLSLLLLSLEAVGLRVSAIVPLTTEADGSITEHPDRGVTVDSTGRIQARSAQSDLSLASRPLIDRPPGAVEQAPSGVRLVGIDALGQRRSVDYLSLDLSNGGLRPQGAAHRMVSRLIDGTVLIKSASHLLQSVHFTQLSTLISTQAAVVVQDETGLEIETLGAIGPIKVHGGFTEPHELWRGLPAMLRLRDFVERGEPSEAPPFIFGYRKPSGSLILVSSRTLRR